MEPIKINLTSKMDTYKKLSVKSITERDDLLVIDLYNNENQMLKKNMFLHFIRNIYDNEKSNFLLTESVRILGKDNDGRIYTTKIPNKKLYLRSDNKKIRSVVYDDKTFIIETTVNHGIYPQDISQGTLYIELKNYKNETIGICTKDNIQIPYLNGDIAITSGSCITFVNKEKTCGKDYKTVTTYRYDFNPLFVSKREILISNIDRYILEETTHIEVSQNQYYNYTIEYNEDGSPKELDSFGNPVKKCSFYTDTWWKMYEEKNNAFDGEIFVNYGDSNSYLELREKYWSTNVELSTPINESSLGSYDNFSTKFVENLEDSLIPDFIDMERIKYSPMVYDSLYSDDVYYKLISNNDKKYPVVYTKKWVDVKNLKNGEKVNVYECNIEHGMQKIEKDFYFDAYSISGGNLFREEKNEENGVSTICTYIPNNEIINSAFAVATSITFDIHFRKRDELKTENNNNTSLTSGNVYTDGWFINENEDLITWWNGFDYSGETFDSKKFEEFYNESGTTSDLIGYLNFTDNDIFYRKKKVSQSFLRFSYYTSKDPIEQKLLFYSTSFLDSTSLYSKYLKQMTYMRENDLFNTKKNEKLNLNAAVVLCDSNAVSARLDTKIVLTNEYDRTKSSEGFNLYLFAEDKNINLENAEKTIYMKVEFNHAGNGKTIPLIMWPKNERGEYIELTTENFIENLYIPIKLVYLNGRYTYYIPNAINNSDGNIGMILFEPKISHPEDKPISQ